MTNDIILIDGIRYCRYTPKSEAEFERMIVENAARIFGEEAIYLDIKKLIKTEWGQGTIPDGFLFYPEQRRFVLVEVELSSHPVFEHISKQVNKFISAFANYKSRQKLASMLKEYIEEEPALAKRMKPLLGTKGLYEFLEFDVFEPLAEAKNFEVIVIIEDKTPAVCEALSWLHPSPSLIEAAVYAREGAEMVKALRFEPQFKFVPQVTEITPVLPPKRKQSEITPSNDKIQFPIPVYATYKDNRFEAKLFADGSMEVNGEKFKSPSGAGKAVKDGKSTNGWTFWKIKENDETIDKLYHIVKGTKKEYRSSPNDLNTIIVPAHEDGFQETFLGENSWYAIRLNKKKIPDLKYIAVYRKAPVSAITHLAEIDRIEKYKDTGKFIVYFKGKAKEIEHIKRIEGGFAPQCPVYTNYQRLIESKSTSDAI